MNTLRETAVRALLVAGVAATQSALAEGPVEPAAAMIAQPFPLTEVRLLDGPFRDAMLRDKAYLLSLDPDRFLYNFRVNYGLPTSATAYGGWEDPGSEQRGCIVGHYLTACSQMYGSTGDPLLKARVDYLVDALAQCQAAATNAGFHAGYLSGFPESHIDRVINLQPVWAPWYAIHKIMAGLLDSYQWCDNPQALDVLEQEADWVKTRLDPLTTEQVQAMLDNEFGGMGEVLANLYAVTGNADYLNTARRFDHARMFDPLAADIDPLDGYHANTQIPKMTAAAREYEMTGENRYHEIATFFWERVAHHRSFVIGGDSDREHFFPISEFPLHLSAETCETCNTYNMLKLTRHLFEWQPDSNTMDFYERGLFNHILASQEPEQGMVTYLVSLKPGHFKTYSTPENSFWCCVGTGMENHSKYGNTIFYHGTNSLYVNLFIASELNWPEKALVVRQETTFPETNTTRLTFQCTNGVALDLKIRQPGWAGAGFQISVNGTPQNLPSDSDGYVTVSRTWQDGDDVRVKLPMTLHTESLPGDSNTVALLYGPIVLAGELGTRGMPGSDFAVGQLDYVGVADPLVPVLVGDLPALLTNTTPVVGHSLTFQTHNLGQPRDVTLIPFYRLHHQRYSVYWKRYSLADWTGYAAAVATAEARNVDEVAIGDSASESAHDLQGQNSNTGSAFGLNWRDANNGGWFSYLMSVRPDEAMKLEVKYWGSDTGGRVFDILVDGQVIATQTLDNNLPGQFFDVDYPIPSNLTAGKTNVTVRFQAHAGMIAGGIFGLNVLTLADPGALLSIGLTAVTNPPPDEHQAVQVVANYEHLTNHSILGSPWLVLASSDSNVLTVNMNGIIQPVHRGTATVAARYLGHVASAAVSVGEPVRPAVRHRYSFSVSNLVNGTNVLDRANPADSSLYAVLRGGAVIAGNELQLDGSTGTYVDLPSGILSNYAAVTIEAWASFGATPTWSYLFAFGDTRVSGSGANGFLYTPHSAYGDHRLIVLDEPGHEFLITQPGYLDEQSNQQIVTVLELNNGYVALYVDGALIGEREDVPFGANSILNVHSYLGRSTFEWDPMLVGSVSEVRIYEGRLTADDVAASYAAGPARMLTRVAAALTGDGHGIRISWPAAAADAVLQYSTNLTTQPAWHDVALAPVLTNAHCEVTLPLLEDVRLFRLRQ